MQNFSNSQIIEIIRNRPGGIQTFLLQVPIQDLRDAIDQQERLQDLRFKNSRASFNYKENVLDFPLKNLIKRCKDEGFINYLTWKLAEQNSRLVNHPYYGRMLVNRLPEKYYIGDKSRHYSHARKIQKLYGIHNLYSQDQQQQNNSSVNLQEYEEGNQNNQKNQQQNQRQKQEQQQQNQSQINQDSFIVSDQQQEQLILSQEQSSEQHKRFKKQKTKSISKKQKKKSSPNKLTKSKAKIKYIQKSQIVSKKINRKIQKVQINQKTDKQQQLSKYLVTEKCQNSSLDKSFINKSTLIQIDNVAVNRHKMCIQSESE